MNKRHRRRKRATESNKNFSTASIVVALISFVSVLFLIAAMIIAINTGGRTPRFIGALGMLFFLGSFVCIFIGRKRFKMNNYNLLSRILGFVVPIASAALWALLYLFGLVFA